MTLAVHPRQELLSYIPKPLQGQVNTASIRGLVDQELRQMQRSSSSKRAQIAFIGRSTSRPAACEGQGPGGGRGRGEGVKAGGEEASILQSKVG